MNKKWITPAILVLVSIAGYFGYNAWQEALGQQALVATHLEFKPLDRALAQAKAANKPVLADFSAIWCPTCRVLHATVFTDPAVRAAISSGYVLSRIDYDSAEAPAFMSRYGVSGFPTLLVLDGDGKLLRRVPVTLDPAAFLAQLKG